MPTLVSGTAQKGSGDTVRVSCDFGDIQQLKDGADVIDGALFMPVTVASYDVTCTDTGAPTISGIQLDYPYVLSAKFSGGSVGDYTILFRITLDDADSTVITRACPLRVI